jgi:VWFA-related protein
MIVSIDNDFEILSEMTGDKKVLQKAIKNAEIGDDFGTVIYDALDSLINNTLRKIKGRKAIILLTDGQDFGSYISRRDLLAGLSESDTVIYPVFYETGGRMQQRIQDRRFPFPGRGGGMGRRGGIWRPGGGMGRGRGGRGPGNRPNIERRNQDALEFLQQVADSTSGRLFQEKIADLDSVFRQIADELKRQYLIGFYPPDDITPGTVHKIRVQVTRPGTVVRSKTTYTSQTR